MILGPKTTLTLKRSTQTVDSMGSFVDTWAAVASIKGVLYAEYGQEIIQNRKRTVTVSHIFICDIPEVTPTELDIFVDSSGQVYEIIFVDNVAMDNQHLEIMLNRRT